MCLNIGELIVTTRSKLIFKKKKKVCSLCYSQAANGVIALVAKAVKRDKEWFSYTTGGTVSEGGKQQRYQNFCVSGH